MAQVSDFSFLKDKIIPTSDASLSIASSAVLYGLSVYTVLPIRITKSGMAAFRVSDHFKRLCNSAKLIGIDTFEPSWTEERFLQTIKDLVEANTIATDVFLRATVHVTELVPGTRSHGLASSVSMFLYEASPILPSEGAKIKISPWERVSDKAIPPRAKVNGAYVNSVLAKQDALDNGYDDALFLNACGKVSELSAANIFLVKNGMLITPSVGSDILEGITRRTLIELASEMNISCEEREVAPEELYTADEIFACGTSAFVAPILEIDGKKIGDGSIGSITAGLQKAYGDLLRGEHPRAEELFTKL